MTHKKIKTSYLYHLKDKYSTILLQNAFPTLEKYIEHVHTINGAHVRVADNLKDEILENFNSLLVLKKQGTNLFFTNIDKIKEKMLKELE